MHFIKNKTYSVFDKKQGSYALLLIIILFAIFLFLRLKNISDIYFWNDDLGMGGQLIHLQWKEVVLQFFQKIKHAGWPIIPMLTIDLLSNLFGPHVLVFRLPALFISSVSFVFLYLLLKKIFKHPVAIYLPLLAFAFSIPTILYGQSMQAPIYFFLTSMIQVYLFFRLTKNATTKQTDRQQWLAIVIFSLCSFILFFINYMSIFITGTLLGYYFFKLLFSDKYKTNLHTIIKTIDVMLLSLIPLGLIVYWRLTTAAPPYRKYFEGIYYFKDPTNIIQSIQEFFHLTYDFLTYHFNFVYTTNWYIPKGWNVLSLLFVLLCCYGLVHFLLKKKWRIFPFLLAVFAFLIILYLKITPFGGIRHTLTYAPFLFIFLGYGIEGIINRFKKYQQSVLLTTLFTGLFCLLVVVPFCYSANNFYTTRKSSVDLNKLLTYAQENQVNTIAGWADTTNILTIMDHSQKKLLTKNGLKIIPYNDRLNREPEDYLLVGYRSAIDANWNAQWNESIPSEKFKEKTEIVPLEKTMGPFDLKTVNLAVQSIYYPTNGFFVYLIKTKSSGLETWEEITNGDFDSATHNWSLMPNVVLSNETGYQGKALKIELTATATKGIYQAVSVIKEQEYTLTFYHKNGSGNISYYLSSTLNGQEIKPAEDISASYWKKVSYSFKAPSDIVYIQFDVRSTGEIGDYAFIDEVSLKEKNH